MKTKIKIKINKPHKLKSAEERLIFLSMLRGKITIFDFPFWLRTCTKSFYVCAFRVAKKRPEYYNVLSLLKYDIATIEVKDEEKKELFNTLWDTYAPLCPSEYFR